MKMTNLQVDVDDVTDVRVRAEAWKSWKKNIWNKQATINFQFKNLKMLNICMNSSKTFFKVLLYYF